FPCKTNVPGPVTCASPRLTTGPGRPLRAATAASSVNVPHARVPPRCAKAAMRPAPSLLTVTSTSAHWPITALPLMATPIVPLLLPPHCSEQWAVHCAVPESAEQLVPLLSRVTFQCTVPAALVPLNFPWKSIVPLPFVIVA